MVQTEVEQTIMTHILGRELGPRVTHDYSGDWEFSLVIHLGRGETGFWRTTRYVLHSASFIDNIIDNVTGVAECFAEDELKQFLF